MSTHQNFGWIDQPDAVDDVLSQLRHPVFGAAAGGIRDSGKGKIALLYKAVEAVAGYFPQRKQTIGDCVSHGMAYAVDVLTCVEIQLKGEQERWVAEAATEPIYAGSRVEIGNGQLGNGDGSIGAWAAKWVKEYGVLLRKLYEYEGRDYDLREYDGRRAREWGKPRNGCPDLLEPTAREHPVRTFSLVTSYEECRDAEVNGYPCTVASNQGFTSTRDEDGFCRPSGSWAHQMSIIAVDDEYKRPGCLIQNSWGPDWVSGPKRHDQPDGSFWADADVVDKMLRRKDSFAYSQYEGYPAQDLDHLLI